MRNSIRQWLSAPVFPDDKEKTWRASLLNNAINICLFIVLLVTVGNLIGGTIPTTVIVIDFIIMAVLVLIRHLNLQGKVFLAGVLLVSSGILLITAASGGLGTIRAPNTTFYLLIIIISGMLFGRRGLILSFVASSLAVLGLVLLERADALPEPNYTVTISHWIAFTAAFGLTGALTYSSYRSYQEALKQSFVEMTERERSQKAYENLVNNSLQAFAIFQNERFVFVNAETEKLTGYTKEELYAMPAEKVFDLVPEAYREERIQTFRDRMTGKALPNRVEMCFARKDGEIRWLESFASVTAYQGKPALQAAYLDITDRKNAEKEIKESEARLKGAEKVAQLGHWELDIRQNKLYWSEEIYRTFEMSLMQSNASYEDFLAVVHPDDRTLVDEVYSTSLKTKKPFSLDHRILLRDGTVKYVHEQCETFYDEEGNAVRSIGTIQDITERKMVEDQLRKLFRAVDAAPVTVVITDKEGCIEYANPYFAKITGYEIDEALGKNPSILRSDLTPKEIYEDLWQTILRGETWEGEFANRKKNGEIYYELAQISPIFDAKENITHFVAIKRDITERKRITKQEREQRTLAEALRNTAETLNSSLELNEILSIILDEVVKVVHYDSASIARVEGQEICVLQTRGFTNKQKKWIVAQSFKLEDFATYRQVIESRESLVIPDTQKYSGWVNLPDTEWIRSHIEAPVIIGGKVIALVNLHSKEPGYYSHKHAENLQAFANQVAVAMQNAMLFEEIKNLAITDDLTSLYNRRGFFEICRREIGRLQRFHRPFSVLFVDIDHFKQFNDRYSYETGDKVLQSVATILQDNVREIDVVGRYGGEEIVILLPEIHSAEALETGERLRSRVEAYRIPHNDDELGVTISIGVATLTFEQRQIYPVHIEGQEKIFEEIIAKAGQALHVSKQQGRNRVTLYHGE